MKYKDTPQEEDDKKDESNQNNGKIKKEYI